MLISYGHVPNSLVLTSIWLALAWCEELIVERQIEYCFRNFYIVDSIIYSSAIYAYAINSFVDSDILVSPYGDLELTKRDNRF
jgi:hypothetical protein